MNTITLSNEKLALLDACMRLAMQQADQTIALGQKAAADKARLVDLAQDLNRQLVPSTSAEDGTGAR